MSERLSRLVGLADKVPGEDPHNLLRTSMFFEMEEGRRALVDEIERAVQESKAPSPLLHMLAAMSFRVILTTNFDTLFERALRLARKEPEIAVYQKDATRPHQWDDDPTFQRPHVIKLHGDIETNRESIDVTDEDYIHFLLRMNEPRERNFGDAVSRVILRALWDGPLRRNAGSRAGHGPAR